MHSPAFRIVAAALIGLAAHVGVVLIPQPRPPPEITDAPSPTDTPPDPPGVGEADEIRVIRSVLGSPATALAEAVIALDAQVKGLRLGNPEDPAARLDAVETVRGSSERSLHQARNNARRVSVPGRTDVADQAREAWAEVLAAADAVADAAEGDLQHVEVLADADGTLIGIVDLWNEPGSYSEQLARFDAAADRAAGLADFLRETVDPRPSCSDSLANRIEAADFVASATDELRALVRDRRGVEFDARRDELVADPFGLGAELAELDHEEERCWDREGPTAVATAEFREAVSRLEAILNP